MLIGPTSLWRNSLEIVTSLLSLAFPTLGATHQFEAPYGSYILILGEILPAHLQSVQESLAIMQLPVSLQPLLTILMYYWHSGMKNHLRHFYFSFSILVFYFPHSACPQ